MEQEIKIIEEKRKTRLQDRLHEVLINPNKIYDEFSAFSEIKEENVEEVSISDFMDAEMIDQQEMENITPYDFMDFEE